MKPQTISAVPLPVAVTRDLRDRLTCRLVASRSTTSRTTFAPYTGEPIVDFPLATSDDVANAFDSARQAQVGWAATPVGQRSKILLRFHDLVLSRQDEVLDLIQLENGKTRRDAFLEVCDVAVTSRYYARTANSQLRPKRRRGATPLVHTRELRHPKGVVVVISPWNYPLSMGATDSLAALVAGNAVVQKPDTQTALTALWALDLMVEAGLPEGVWQMVVGSGADLGPALLNHGDFVMFTGSTASGRTIAATAGERLIGASLELGGKNPLVVFEDADLDRAVDGAIGAFFSSSGQLCISAERAYVHQDVYDEFLARLQRRVERMRVGGGYDFTFDMGALTTLEQLETVSAHVEDAVVKGATVVTGGRPRPDIGPLFYEPTVLTGVRAEMICHRHETFGPVVAVYPFATEAEAVRLANDTEYGLNASVWTSDGKRGRRFAARINTGTVNINDPYIAAWGSVDAPMGGMGASGLGRRHGSEGLLKYTEAQTVAHQRLIPHAPPRGMSHERWADLNSSALRVLRRVGSR